MTGASNAAPSNRAGTPDADPRAPHALGARRRSFRLFVVLWLLWGVLIGVIRYQHPGMEIGESWGDSDIIAAGRFFDVHGYALTHHMPRLETALPASGEHLKVYNTFPPGPFYIHQAVKALGITSLHDQRIVSLIYTHFGELLLFLFIRRITRSGGLALIAACLHMFSLPYAGYSTGFWVNMGQPTLFAALYAWARFEDALDLRRAGADARPGRWLTLAALVTFIDFWIVFEHGPLIAIFVAGRAIVRARTRRLSFRAALPTVAAAAVVAAMPALVMFLRILHTAAAKDSGLLGGVRHFIASAGSRSWDNPKANTFVDVGIVWLSRLGFPWSGDPVLAHNRQFMFPVLGPVILGLWLALACLITLRWRDPRLASRGVKRGLGVGILLVIGGLSWTVLMRNHVWTHLFTIFTLMPGLAVLMASLAWGGIALALPADADRATRPAPARVLAGAPILLSAALIAAMLGNLAHSDLLNHAWQLDERKRERVKSAEREYGILADAGQRLRNVDRLYLFPKLPAVTHALGVPFIHQTAPPTDHPRKGELVALETWSPRARAAALQLADRHGFPDLCREPSRLIIFPSARGRSLGLQADVEGLGRILDVRIARTLDNRDVAMMWRIAAPGIESVLGRVSLGVVLRDSDGREVERRTAWLRVAADDAAIVWCTLPASSWRRASSAAIFAWNPADRKTLTWSSDALPAGVALAPDGRSLICDLDRWAPWAERSQRRKLRPDPEPVPSSSGS